MPRLVDRMKQIPELRDVASDQENNGLGLKVDIDRDTAGRFGITPQNVDDTLYDAFGQRQVSTIFTQANQYHVILETGQQWQQSADSLPNLRIQIGAASQNLASTVALAGTNTAPDRVQRSRRLRWALLLSSLPSQSLSAINHQGKFPVVTLSFNLAPGASLGAGLSPAHPGRL